MAFTMRISSSSNSYHSTTLSTNFSDEPKTIALYFLYDSDSLVFIHFLGYRGMVESEHHTSSILRRLEPQLRLGRSGVAVG
jgi:hypothetical protein